MVSIDIHLYPLAGLQVLFSQLSAVWRSSISIAFVLPFQDGHQGEGSLDCEDNCLEPQ